MCFLSSLSSIINSVHPFLLPLRISQFDVCVRVWIIFIFFCCRLATLGASNHLVAIMTETNQRKMCIKWSWAEVKLGRLSSSTFYCYQLERVTLSVKLAMTSVSECFCRCQTLKLLLSLLPSAVSPVSNRFYSPPPNSLQAPVCPSTEPIKSPAPHHIHPDQSHRYSPLYHNQTLSGGTFLQSWWHHYSLKRSNLSENWFLSLNSK